MSAIKIISQHIKNLSFNVAQAPHAFSSIKDKPDIQISIDIDAVKLAAENYEIILKVSADAKLQNQQMFICDVSYAGIFHLQNLEGEMLEQVLLIYCPNMLFPFLRRIVANVTIDAGFAPLMLDPIDFAQLYARRKAIEQTTPISDAKN